MSVARTSAQGESIDATLFALTGVGGSFRGHRPWSHHDALTMTDERVCVWTISRGSKTLAGVADWLPDMSPAAAVEVLSERGLWPWSPGDIDAPRWWCDRCARQGWQSDAPVACVCDRSDDTPPSLADLVAVASLGVATLRRVAALVRELHAVTRGETGATLVWRVMTREALEEHHERLYEESWNMNAHKRSMAHAFSCETFVRQEHERDPWPETPYTDDNDAVRAAWPILRALAVHEDETPTGLHLVAADEKRVVIAVEAL